MKKTILSILIAGLMGCSLSDTSEQPPKTDSAGTVETKPPKTDSAGTTETKPPKTDSAGTTKVEPPKDAAGTTKVEPPKDTAGTTKVEPPKDTAGTTKVVEPPKVIPKPVDFEMRLGIFYRDAKSQWQTSEELTEGTALASGDQFSISFTPSMDGYVYIYSIDSAGVLADFVRDSKQSNKVNKDVTYDLPGKGNSFTLDNVVGTETIYIVASQTPDVFLNPLNKELKPGLTKTELRALAQKFQDTINSRSLVKVNATKTVEKNKGMLKFCPTCTYKLTFKHNPAD